MPTSECKHQARKDKDSINQKFSTFPTYQLMGHKIINENSVLKLHDNLFKLGSSHMLLNANSDISEIFDIAFASVIFQCKVLFL
jgi:hypothetical protein